MNQRTNRQILDSSERHLSGLENQRRFILRVLGHPMPCPNCHHRQSFIEAKGETIETFDVMKTHPDDCTCVNCGRTITHTVPFVSVGGPGWHWEVQPVSSTNSLTSEKKSDTLA